GQPRCLVPIGVHELFSFFNIERGCKTRHITGVKLLNPLVDQSTFSSGGCWSLWHRTTDLSGYRFRILRQFNKTAGRNMFGQTNILRHSHLSSASYPINPLCQVLMKVFSHSGCGSDTGCSLF